MGIWLALCGGIGVAGSVAHAGSDPTAVLDEGGTVVVVAVLDAPGAQVRSILADSGEVRDLFPDVLDERLEAEASGPCMRIRRRTRGLFRPLELFARRCPTRTGYREELLKSSDFGAYTSEWIVREGESGTRIEYRLRTEIDAPLPASAVTAAVRRAALRAVSRLVRRAGRD